MRVVHVVIDADELGALQKNVVHLVLHAGRIIPDHEKRNFIKLNHF